MAQDRGKQSKMVDRISDLPNNVIDIILRNVPLRDAVRTSILSSKWRLQWTRKENLVMDRDFFESIFGHRRLHKMPASKYLGIVNNILLSHSGPIRKFTLHVPSFYETRNVVNLWVLAVSRHGVQDLTLNFVRTYHHEGPSYVFQCLEMKHLSLNVRHPPRNIRQLSSLLSLHICCEKINGDLLTNMISGCPRLTRLSLNYLYKDGSFTINAPELKDLQVVYYLYTDFVLKNTPNLSTIALYLNGRGPSANSPIKWPNITDSFGAVPIIENITLTGIVLMEWGLLEVPKMLSAPLENHLSLSVVDLHIYSVNEVRSMFCILNSSPLLQTLDISIGAHYSQDIDRPPDTSNYLKSQIRESENLWRLRTVEISKLMGREPELVLIEFILSCCPVLEKLYLSSNSSISSDAEYKMMTDIMQFRRASAQAKMIYTKSDEVLVDDDDVVDEDDDVSLDDDDDDVLLDDDDGDDAGEI